MASAYLRTIEFKVKDQALKQSVDKLGKSLGSIDKSVAGINKQFGNLAKYLKGIGAEFKTINTTLSKIKKVSVGGGLDPKSLNKSAVGAKKLKKIIKSVQDLGRDGLFSGRGKTTDFNVVNKQATELIETFKNLDATFNRSEAGMRQQAAALRAIAAESNVATDAGSKYAQAITGATQAEQKLRFAQLSRIRVESELYGKRGKTKGDFLTRDQVLGMESSIGKESGIAKNIASLNVYKGELQRILAITELHSEEYKKVEGAIARVNKLLVGNSEVKKKTVGTDKELNRLLKEREKIAKREQALMKEAQKFTLQTIRGLGQFAGRGLGELFGVLGGKRGPVPQLFAGDASLQVIKDMIRFVPLLDKKLKDQIRSWATVGQVAARVLAGIKIASIGLSSVLGGAQWVTSAVKGFIDFENAAAKSIWRIQNNWTKFQGIMGAALMFGFNPFGKGGAYDLAMGGADRRENKRYTKQSGGGTDLQINEKGLEKMNMLLSNRNRTASDYTRILLRAVQLEKEISQETKLQSIMREHASGQIARDIKKRDIQRKKELRDKRRDRRRSFEQRREDFEFEQAQWAGQTYMGTEAQGLMVNPSAARRRRGLVGSQPGSLMLGGRVRNDVWRRYQRMRAGRIERQGRMRENLMLGAGFPMLFGGGVGSVAGGVGGALMQSRMGAGKGFGAQILLSAAGQQIDAFVMKAQELGKALRKPTENLSALVQAAGLTGTALENQIKQLEKLGLKGSAATLVTDRLKAILGEGGYGDLQKFSKEWEKLANLLSIAQTRLMAFVSGPLAALVKLLQFYDKGQRAKAAARDATTQVNKEFPGRTGARTRVRDFLFGGQIMPGISQGQDMRSRWKELFRQNMDNDPGGANAVMAAKIAKVQGADNNDLAERVKLEQNRLDMSSNQFAIKEKELEIKRQELEIQWQSEEYGKLTDAREKETLALKIKKLGLERQINLAQLANLKTGTEIKDLYAGIAATIEDGLVNAIEGAIQGTKTLGDVASSVFRMIGRMLLQYGVSSFLGSMPGKVGDFFSRRAAGGPVTGGDPYIVGEKGPELFVPNSSGNIVPNHAMGGSMVINVDASGSSVEGDAERSRQLGELIGAAVQSEIIRQQRPGGTLF